MVTFDVEEGSQIGDIKYYYEEILCLTEIDTFHIICMLRKGYYEVISTINVNDTYYS